MAPGTSNERVLKDYIDRLKLDVKVVTVRDHAEGMLALETDRIDAYVHDEVGEFAYSPNRGSVIASKWSGACCRSILTA